LRNLKSSDDRRAWRNMKLSERFEGRDICQNVR